ncbi:MAG: tRNA (adenosine(37)-N6)-threonylcarbamoyltransferase complex ATPase subunit type 1 TsaE [Betaproteobacteria bacterium]|nr:tRNA (adenosine(37)-N6)-threonylcarbamoyltransferase complex ATPase subunit type 1 TsaE [Betaproteobacteria bacterium]
MEGFYPNNVRADGPVRVGERWFLKDAQATEDWARRWAVHLVPGLVITLQGALGAGKTAFVRGVLRGLGVTGTVRSPTYAWLETYELSRLYCYHFDFYRVTDEGTVEEMGFRECFRQDSLCFVEWPERVSNWLPRADVAWHLAPQDEGRCLILHAATPRGLATVQPMDGC